MTKGEAYEKDCPRSDNSIEPVFGRFERPSAWRILRRVFLALYSVRAWRGDWLQLRCLRLSVQLPGLCLYGADLRLSLHHILQPADDYGSHRAVRAGVSRLGAEYIWRWQVGARSSALQLYTDGTSQGLRNSESEPDGDDLQVSGRGSDIHAESVSP